MKRKQTFNLARTAMLLLVMLCSIGAWANEQFTVHNLRYIVVSESSKTVNVLNYSGTMPENYNMVIPASVTNPNNSTLYTVIGIESYAFMNKTNLKSVSIPASVTRIGQQAFDRCTNLETVSFPDGNNITYVGKEAFNRTGWLDNQPNGVVYIGKVAYLGKNLSGDISINDGTESISDEAFLNCTGLTSITIPNNVTYIGSSAFAGCTSLTSIAIPNSVTVIQDCAFKNCTSLTSITIPNSVTIIQENAFKNCTSLTSITIPASVETIMEQTFYGCENLKTVTIYAPSCYLNNYDAFLGCNNLANIYVFSDLVDTYKGAINWKADNIKDKIKAIPNQSGNCGTTDHESEVTWELALTSTSSVLTISGTARCRMLPGKVCHGRTT